MNSRHFRKDESLDRLAELINVAQFVSFSPGLYPRQEYSRVLGFPPNHRFTNPNHAICELIERSPERSVNVRSFAPDNPKSHEFIYGLTRVEDVAAAARRIAGAGLHVIVNETVDVRDGGVSGVVQNDVIEFSPDDTPRCVEKPGVASLPASWGKRILSRVYGVSLDFPVGPEYRLEFTIHPKPRGWKHSHVLGWELEQVGLTNLRPMVSWPNNFSRLIGDKAFGLMLAAEIGLPVPLTSVISRRIAPFAFGKETSSHEWWLRTCPREQVPGKFTTHRGWIDPFALMAIEDPGGEQIASVLAQRGVPPEYSGALIVDAHGDPLIEGRRGEGEIFMRGIARPEELPSGIVDDVLRTYQGANDQLGPVRFEWVHDGRTAWVLQLHKGATATTGKILVPGNAYHWHRFETAKGLEELRRILDHLKDGDGVELAGQVGLTSHVADVIRKAGKPARLA